MNFMKHKFMITTGVPDPTCIHDPRLNDLPLPIDQDQCTWSMNHIYLRMFQPYFCYLTTSDYKLKIILYW